MKTTASASAFTSSRMRLLLLQRVVSLAGVHLQFLWSAHLHLQRVESGRYLLRRERHIVLSAQVLLNLREHSSQVLTGLRYVEPAAGLVGQALQHGVTPGRPVLAMQGEGIDLDFAAQRNRSHIA